MGLKDIKLRRWLSDSTLVVLAMHPTKPKKVRHIYEDMKKMGFQGTFGHARKAVNTITDTLVYSPVYRHWALTATGLTRRQQILKDMNAVLLMAARMPAPPEPSQDEKDVHARRIFNHTKVYNVYQPNGSGQPVCVGCGSAMGMPHDPACLHGSYAAPLTPTLPGGKTPAAVNEERHK